MMNFEDLQNIDIFFFHGDQVDLEIEHDIAMGLLQPKRSLYYDRQDGCGLKDRENYPNAVLLRVLGAYDVMKFIAFRNSEVTDGRTVNGEATIDRRVATSQTSVIFKQNGPELDVDVLYIPFKDIQKPATLSLPITI